MKKEIAFSFSITEKRQRVGSTPMTNKIYKIRSGAFVLSCKMEKGTGTLVVGQKGGE